MTSCENFLKATQVKEEIEEAIEIANSSPILYHIIADKDSGTVSPSQATLKKKQSVNLLFTPADGWSFICWEALDRTTGEPVPDAIQFENPQKLETKAVIIKPTENLMIHPKCQLVPKVIEITPKFDNSGCDQDRTIEVVFNKPVNPQTLDFTGISITTPEGAELFSTDPTKSFFETPYFSNDNKVLNIPTIKGKFLLLPDDLDENTTVYNSKKSTDDITVRLDLSAVKDADGLAFDQPEPHTYRVNKIVDNVPPVITDIHLFSTSDETDYFYKELTDKPFFKEDGITLNWSSAIVKYEDGTTQYQNGDYSQNHVSHVYITISGYDSDSEIRNVRVHETYVHDINGNIVNATSSYQDFRITDVETELTVNEDPLFKFDYNFDPSNTNNGLFLLQISIFDNANNESQIVDYWVIKDKAITCNKQTVSLKIGEDVETWLENIPVYNEQEGHEEYLLNVSTFSITSTPYYKSFKSQRLLTVTLNYENESEKSVLFDNFDLGTGQTLPFINQMQNALANNKRDPSKTSYWVTSLHEENGLTGSVIDIIPYRINIDYMYEENSKLYPIYSKRLNDNDQFTFSANNLIVKEENETGYKVYGSGAIDLSELEDSKTYYIYVRGFANLKNSNNSIVHSVGIPIGNAYVYKKGETSSTTVNFPELVLPPDDKITYKRNSGLAEFSVTLNYSPNENYSNYTFIPCFLSTNGSFSYSSVDLNFKILNGYSYKAFLIAKNSSGKIVGKTTPSAPINFYKEDNISPLFIFSDSFSEKEVLQNNKTYLNPNTFRCYCYWKGNGYSSYGYDITKNRTRDYCTWVDYYLVPYAYGTGISLEEIKKGGFEHGRVYMDTTKEWFEIPYNNIPQGKYFLYFYYEDNSKLKNYTLDYSRCPLYYFRINSEICVDDSTSSSLNIKIPNFSNNLKPAGSELTTSDWKANISIQYLEGNEWTDTDVFETEMTKGEEFSSYQKDYVNNENNILGKYLRLSARYRSTFSSYYDYNIYLNPLYIYTGYYKHLADYEAAHPGKTAPAYCTSKTWMPMANGWQIFNDKPCFVHTRFCSKNLTEPGNLSKDAAYEWEARAQETGIVYNNGSTMTFSYTDDNLDDVPSGYYYTTICHFADGTVVMSEVKQKE